MLTYVLLGRKTQYAAFPCLSTQCSRKTLSEYEAQSKTAWPPDYFPALVVEVGSSGWTQAEQLLQA